MSLQLKCLIPLTGIACGLTAAALHVLDPGMAATGALSLASLVSAFKERCAKHGMDEPSLTKKMQTAVIRDWDDADQTQDERDIICDADAAMSQHLADCMLDRRALADSSVSTKPYPQYAAELVVDRLADFDTMFAVPANPNATVPLARRFALSVIVRALETARDDQDYAALLAVDLLLAGNTAHAVTHEKLDQILAKLGDTNLSGDAVKLAIARFVDFKPDASNSEIVDSIQNFERDLAALKAQLAGFAGEDNYVQSLKVEAEAALDDSDLDAARRLFAEAAAAAQAKAVEPVRTAAQLKSALASAHLLALDWEAADKAWREAEVMLAPLDSEAGENIGKGAVNSLYDFGTKYSNLKTLCIAVKRYRATIVVARKQKETEYLIDASNCLANALSIYGYILGPSGLVYIEEAVAIFVELIKSLTKPPESAEWAKLQSNLAAALFRFAQRTDNDIGLSALRDGVAACRAALTVRTEAEMPIEWAETQTNLGAALCLIGDRTTDGSAASSIDEGVQAYRAALRVYSEFSEPEHWAIVQYNLANQFLSGAKDASGAERIALLKESAEAFRAVLRVEKEDVNAFEWAGTQNSLGNALSHLGNEVSGREGFAFLVEAGDVYQEALRVYTKGGYEFQSQMVSNNICHNEYHIALRSGARIFSADGSYVDAPDDS